MMSAHSPAYGTLFRSLSFLVSGLLWCLNLTTGLSFVTSVNLKLLWYFNHSYYSAACSHCCAPIWHSCFQ